MHDKVFKNPSTVARIWFNVRTQTHHTYQKNKHKKKHACMLNKVTKAPLTEIINLRAFIFTDMN